MRHRGHQRATHVIVIVTIIIITIIRTTVTRVSGAHFVVGKLTVIGETRFLFFPRAIEFVWFEKKWPWPFFPPPPISHHLLTDRAVDLSTGCVVHRFILASLEHNHSRSFLLGARRSTKYSSCAFFPTNCQQNRPPSRAAVLRYRGYRLWELKYSKGRDQV